MTTRAFGIAMSGGLAFAVAASLVACGGGTPPPQSGASPLPSAASIESTTFAPELQIDLGQSTRTKSGAYYRDLVKGTGAVAGLGDHLRVRYEARLPDGRLVNGGPTSAPVDITLGSSVVRGWVETIPGMRVGGIRRAIVPPELGYGSRGSPDANIPPNAIVIFDIELLKVETH
ncbi:MAG TPA: FKBP-type peptidyl-prolyl cis-trans isomerase [Gemmatimonadaceae bacterium]|nr:FKBP-type peptidyl-prolyl cis-trans isomerase [Gemmatimonadaceae bacterium]